MALTRAFLNSQRYDESKGSINQTNHAPIIHNGDMNISQRGDLTGVNSAQYISADRFFINMINLGAFTFAASTDTPGFGFSKSLKIDCTTADGSPASSDNMYLTQLIEGKNLQMMRKGTASAKTSTIAYWIKSNKTGNYVVELWDRTNDRHVGKVVTISQANTWEKHVCNFPADTSGALANSNARSIMISWAFDSGSNFTSGTLPSAWQARVDANRFVGTTLAIGDSTDNEILITGVQWEMGTYDSETMPPFQFEDIGTSLKRCQRYYFRQGNEGGFAALGSGVCENTSQAYVMINLPTTMRASPSASFTNNITLFDGDTFNTSSSINSTQKGTNCIRLTVTGNSGVANGNGATLHVENDTSFAEFSAEL